MSVAEAQSLPGTDVKNVPHNVTSSEFVYYRVYHKDGAIATKRPAYLNDTYIGRIKSKWVAPPHTAGSLKLCLCSMENIDPKWTKLFTSVSNQSALENDAPISLKSNQTLGIIPEDPVMLFSEAMPQAEMQPWTENFRVAPDSESPLAPRFYFMAGAHTSKAPIDAEQPWVSKIDLYSILPPVSVTSLLHVLNMREGTSIINTSPQLLAQDGQTTLGDDQIFTTDGNWLGPTAEDHLVLKFGRLPFAEGAQYTIQNCCTGNSLAFSIDDGKNVKICSPGYDDGPWKHFTVGFQDDGSVTFRNEVWGCWIGRDCRSSQTGHGFCFIPSTTNRNYFFICEGDPVYRKAFYDPGASDGARYLALRKLDTTDTRQMWSLTPAVPFQIGKAASSGSEFVYYRVYHKDSAIATKRPAYLNDIYLGRIRSKWVTLPHTAGSLKLCLCSMENIDPKQTKLFASVSNQSALADEAPISLKSNQTLGIIPEDPVILFSNAMPQAKMEPGAENSRVAPDSESPLAPRFLFYGVYTEAGPQASKAPIDAEQPWVSKIDLYSILAPVSVTSLLHILNVKEGIDTFSRLLAQDGLTPLGDDQIFTKDGNWLGASAEDHLVLKFGRPPFAEGSQYTIQNCCTGNSLAFFIGYGKNVEIYSSGYFDGPWKHFTFKLQDDGGVAFRSVHSGRWIAPDCCTSGTEHGFWLIPSTTNNNYFFICEGDPISRKAFYDPGPSDGARDYRLKLRKLDTTDTCQMWSLIPAVQFQVSSQQARKRSSVVRRFLSFFSC